MASAVAWTSLRRSGSDSEGDNQRACPKRYLAHSIERDVDIAWRRGKSGTRKDHRGLSLRRRCSALEVLGDERESCAHGPFAAVVAG
jgi:hypothetical protein